MRVEPYLNFDGRCEEAIEFYKKEIGAKVNMLMRHKDNPEPPTKDCGMPPGIENKIMHASLTIGDSIVMLSDGHAKNQPKFEGVSLAMAVANDADAKKLFDGLSKGGKVTMPLGKTFFSSSFGMLADKFGIAWMIMVQA
jgi:PhnB protein